MTFLLVVQWGAWEGRQHCRGANPGSRGCSAASGACGSKALQEADGARGGCTGYHIIRRSAG